MTPDELEEIATRARRAFTYDHFHQVAGKDVPALIGEIKRLESLYAGAVAANRLEQDAVRALAAERDEARKTPLPLEPEPGTTVTTSDGTRWTRYGDDTDSRWGQLAEDGSARVFATWAQVCAYSKSVRRPADD